MIPYNEKELLEKISKGDELAFSELFEYHKDRVFSIAIKLTKSTVIAEEILQDVFLKIWLKRTTLLEIHNFSAYLFIVARNDVYKVLKGIAQNYKTTILSEDYPLLASIDSSDPVLDKEYNQILQTAVERLPNQQKQVYKLIKNQGYKRVEVAQQLHLQPETVKFHLTQAMKNIRAFCTLHLSIFIGFAFWVLSVI